VLCGLIVWVGAASAGLSALLQASRIGYAALEIVGACYLIWMGVGSLRSLLRTASDVESDAATVRPADRRSGFAAGFLTDLLNPKIGVLFVGLLPGFVPHGYSVGWTTLGFGVLYIAVTALYFAGLVAAAGTVATWMRAPRVRRRLDAAAGLVLVGFGLRLALDA
jgi:threonine/homoserine/homoserine lactone efflux protein